MFPNPRWAERTVCVKSDIDQALSQIYSLNKTKALDLCRFVVKDPNLVAREVLAPATSSPLRLLHILDAKTGGAMDVLVMVYLLVVHG